MLSWHTKVRSCDSLRLRATSAAAAVRVWGAAAHGNAVAEAQLAAVAACIADEAVRRHLTLRKFHDTEPSVRKQLSRVLSSQKRIAAKASPETKSFWMASIVKVLVLYLCEVVMR